MERSVKGYPDFEDYIWEISQKVEQGLMNHLLIISDYAQNETYTQQIYQELEFRKILQKGMHGDFKYHEYELVPEIPNEGLLGLYQKLFSNKIKEVFLPTVVFLEITSCIEHLDSHEFKTLLAFAQRNQRHTLFIFFLDCSCEAFAIKVQKRIDRVLPIAVCRMSRKTEVVI